MLHTTTIDLPDFWQFCSALQRAIGRANYRDLLGEVAAGRVAGARTPDGQLLAIGGVLPVKDGRGVAWLSVLPAGFGRRGVLLVRAARRYLQRTVASHPGGIVAFVATANVRGHRLARAAGFIPTEVTFSDLRQWRFAWTP